MRNHHMHKSTEPGKPKRKPKHRADGKIVTGMRAATALIKAATNLIAAIGALVVLTSQFVFPFLPM